MTESKTEKTKYKDQLTTVFSLDIILSGGPWDYQGCMTMSSFSSTDSFPWTSLSGTIGVRYINSRVKKEDPPLILFPKRPIGSFYENKPLIASAIEQLDMTLVDAVILSLDNWRFSCKHTEIYSGNFSGRMYLNQAQFYEKEGKCYSTPFPAF